MAEERSCTPRAAPDRAVRVLAEVFLHDSDRFDGVGRALAGSGRSVDIPITGGSMGSSLPEGTVIRIALGDAASCRPGDVVVFRQDETIVAHRALVRTKQHLITRGDARVAPDQPVAFARVLGRATGIVASTHAVQPLAVPRRHWLVRLAGFCAVRITVLALRFSPALAGRWIGLLTRLERSSPLVTRTARRPVPPRAAPAERQPPD